MSSQLINVLKGEMSLIAPGLRPGRNYSIREVATAASVKP